MDVATVVGIVSGLSFIVMAMLLGGAPIDTFIHIPSMMITLGGTLAATLINYPLGDIRGVSATVRNAFAFDDETPAHHAEDAPEEAVAKRARQPVSPALFHPAQHA